eukprot:3984162-Prymnesium_polylepis.1
MGHGHEHRLAHGFRIVGQRFEAALAGRSFGAAHCGGVARRGMRPLDRAVAARRRLRRGALSELRSRRLVVWKGDGAPEAKHVEPACAVVHCVCVLYTHTHTHTHDPRRAESTTHLEHSH